MLPHDEAAIADRLLSVMHGYVLHAAAILFVHGLEWPSPWTPWSGVPLFIFGMLLGPIALPWLSSRRPVGVVRALDAWDERGFRAWMQCGLLYGASLSWPLLFIPAAYCVLDEPRWLLLAPLAVGFTGIGVSTEVRRAPSSSSPRGQATTRVALFALLLPWCLALITTNPVWRFDLSYVESSTHVFEVHPGVDVEMHDAPFWITGADIIVRDTPFGEERQSTFLRAPITICNGALSERGRMVMPSGIHQGAFYVPIAPDGSRLDDGMLDRLLARTRFERFYVFALVPLLPFLLVVYALRKRPTEGGLQLLALHVSTTFAMWWVWSGV